MPFLARTATEPRSTARTVRTDGISVYQMMVGRNKEGRIHKSVAGELQKDAGRVRAGNLK